MKLILGMILFIFSQVASAQSFTVIQNGKNYLCQEQGTTAPVTKPSPSSECEAAAVKNSGFTNGEAAYLCLGVYTTGASDCVQKVYRLNYLSSGYQILNKNQSIELCVGAQLPSPAECLIGTRGGYSGVKSLPDFSTDEIVRICKNTGNKLRGECVRDKYHDIAFEYHIQNIKNGSKADEITSDQAESAKAQAINNCY